MTPKKDKKGGLALSTIFGVAGLIIGLIVVLLIVSTLTNANLISDDKVTTTNIVNESVTFDDINTAQTLWALTEASSLKAISCGTITAITNETATGEVLTSGNITQTGCSLINATGLADDIGNGTIYVSYPYTATESYSKNAVGNMTSNFTSGIHNVSSKIPTILLIIAVIILLGALVLLVRNTGLAGLGSSGNGSL